MKSHSIVITEHDMERLSRLIRGAQHSFLRDKQQLDQLERVLQSAEVQPLNNTPKSVVRIGSRIHVCDIRTRKKEIYTVVFPDEANASLGLISILAPIGIALIGRGKGAVVDALVPGGIRRLRIVHVIQSRDSSGKNALRLSRQITPPNLGGEERVAA